MAGPGRSVAAAQGHPAAAAGSRSVLALTDPTASDPALTGAKAANLARAAAAGLPVLPGVVLTTAAGPTAVDVAALRRAVAELIGPGPWVVRSSSTAEDLGTTSMAGQFRSVLGVHGHAALDDAVRAVLASAGGAPAATPGAPPRPMAVLVQPELDAECGGVLFGVDPVTGQRDRVVVEAVAGGPEAVVSGRATAQRWVLSTRGRVREVDGRPPHAVRHLGRTLPAPHPLLDRHRLRALARLARRTAAVFGRPQDVEWAWDRDGVLWLLQARPVTATGPGLLAGRPVLGPGPVAETFPDPLRPLEQQLWLDPLRAGVARAIGWTGAVDRRRLAASPLVVCVAGRAAVDLEVFGYVPAERSRWRWVDPRPGARKMRAAWRVGRLRAELPARQHALLARVDAWLGAVPRLTGCSDHELLDLLGLAQRELVELHAHEVAAATLRGAAPGSVAGHALRDLAAARAAGLDDAHAVARHPVLLALTPPRIGPAHPLPALTRLPPPDPTGTAAGGPPGPRELLRLRARWVQELTARTVAELAHRLRADGRLAPTEPVALLSLADLAAVVEGHPRPDGGTATGPDGGTATKAWVAGPPLPAQFRLAEDGRVVAAARPGVRSAGGTGAGGGRGTGTVVQLRPGVPPPADAVLVVRTLDPALAGLLPAVAGLVAESGSTLSHLAILAREYRVPTVVAVHDAVHRFPPGTRLLVDGATGEVTPLADASATEATKATEATEATKGGDR